MESVDLVEIVVKEAPPDPITKRVRYVNILAKIGGRVRFIASFRRKFGCKRRLDYPYNQEEFDENGVPVARNTEVDIPGFVRRKMYKCAYAILFRS